MNPETQGHLSATEADICGPVKWIPAPWIVQKWRHMMPPGAVEREKLIISERMTVRRRASRFSKYYGHASPMHRLRWVEEQIKAGQFRPTALLKFRVQYLNL